MVNTLGVNFSSSDLSGISDYAVDDNTNFTINSTGWLNNITALTIGTYELIITVNDTTGLTDTTPYRVIVNDTIHPMFDFVPGNETLEYMVDTLGVNFSASDLSGISGYAVINDDTNFSINSTGWLSNATALSIGTYELTIGINDTTGLTNMTSYKVVVQDTTDPIVSLVSPANDSYDSDGAVTFTYSATDFNLESCTLYGNFSGAWATNETNLTIAIGVNHQVSMNLDDGVYIWNVQCTDSAGLSAFNAANYTITVDSAYPTFDTALINKTVEYYSAFSYNISASDNFEVNSYFVNDTNFATNASGYLMNNTILALGSYSLNVSVNDTSNNVLSSIIIVTVNDTVEPIFGTVANQNVNYSVTFGYQIDATDAHNVSEYAVDDITNFAINATGYLYNNTALNVEIYELTITVNDSSGNENSTTMSVTVRDTLTLPVVANTSSDFDFSDADTNITLFITANNTVEVYVAPSLATPVNTTASLTGVKAINITIPASVAGNLTWALIKMYYSNAEITGLSESSLRMYYYNVTSGDWQEEASQTRFAGSNYVQANVTHFSTYGLFGSAPAAAATTTTTTTTPSGYSGSVRAITTEQGVSVNHKWAKIESNSQGSMSITNNDIGMTKVVFSIKNAVLNPEMKVIKLTDAPEEAGTLAREVYQYLEIVTTNLDNDNIVSAGIDFKVSLDWLKENNLDKSDVKLIRYHDGEWVELDTKVGLTNGIYQYYEAKTPGFSYFSIAAVATAEQAAAEEKLIEEKESVEEITEEETVAEPTVEEEKDVEPLPESKTNYGWVMTIVIVLIGFLAYFYYKKKQ